MKTETRAGMIGFYLYYTGCTTRAKGSEPVRRTARLRLALT
jgi:hypothetical protein